MTKTKQTPQETAADIKHAVNVLITRARDGEYSSAASEKLYRTFEKELDVLTRAADRAADVSALEQRQAYMIASLGEAVEQNARQLVRLNEALGRVTDVLTEQVCLPDGFTTWREWAMSDAPALYTQSEGEHAEAGIDV